MRYDLAESQIAAPFSFHCLASAVALALSLTLASSPVVAMQTGEVLQPKTRPNVVLFFIDDLGYHDLGCYGSENYQTPNIDRLAQQGVRLTQFYSANPVCSPTRAALMTGKAPQRVGITQWINQPNDLHLPLDELTIGEAFQQQGYRTGYIGKWHLGEKDGQLPTAQGFDWMRCVNRGGQPGSYFHPFKRNPRNGVAYWDVPDLEDSQPGDYLTDQLTDQANEFIQSSGQQPFLLCFAHYAVHTPIQSPPQLVEQYKNQFSKLPRLKKNFEPERNGARSRYRQDDPAYAAMVENLDTNVGRVMKQLESLGLSENTIVVFTSDNGGLSTLKRIGPTSVRPLRAGKGWTYEGGIRIPTIIHWPGQLKPAVCAELAITMDLYPTLLELTGNEMLPAQHLDGHSLVSALRGQATEKLNNRFLAWTYPHRHGSGHTPSNAIREGDWKLVQLTDEATPDDQRLELYNLANDIGEKHNLADLHPDRVELLQTKLTEWLEETKQQ